MDSRKKFVGWLIKKARKNKNILLLVGDLGFNFVEEFQKEFPDRFINAGCSEQNMIGVAAGLTIAGKEVYCYSGGIFLNYRCIEQIRNAWMQGLNVKIVATGASGFLGDSHNFRKGEQEPLEVLSKFLKNKNYIKL